MDAIIPELTQAERDAQAWMVIFHPGSQCSCGVYAEFAKWIEASEENAQAYAAQVEAQQLFEKAMAAAQHTVTDSDTVPVTVSER